MDHNQPHGGLIARIIHLSFQQQAIVVPLVALLTVFGIAAKEQTKMVEAISDAVADVAPHVRNAMTTHPAFADIGKRMLLAWSQGVEGLRHERVYAVGPWKAVAAFEGLIVRSVRKAACPPFFKFLRRRMMAPRCGMTSCPERSRFFL